MITRPIIEGMFNLDPSGKFKLHAIMLDDSFSMKGKENITRNTINKILEQIPDKHQLIWINFNGGLQFNGLREDIPSLENLFKVTFHSGLIGNALHTLSKNIEDNDATCELYILTDSQLSSIEELKVYSEKLKTLQTFALVAPQLENNLSITKLKLINEILLPNEHLEIEVLVQNSGIINKDNVLLKLIINDIIVGQQLISLENGALKTFAFKTVLPESGIYKGIIELDADKKLEDNRFYFTLNIPGQLNIAIISNSSETSYYIRESLGALNKFDETLFITEHINLKD